MEAFRRGDRLEDRLHQVDTLVGEEDIPYCLDIQIEAGTVALVEDSQGSVHVAGNHHDKPVVGQPVVVAAVALMEDHRDVVVEEDHHDSHWQAAAAVVEEMELVADAVDQTAHFVGHLAA